MSTDGLIPLNELAERHGGIITVLQADPQEVAKLTALGLLPGLHVTVLQRFPSFVLAVGHTQYAVDAKLASRILVSVEG